MVETKFHVGDSVYSPHWGEGVVTGIDDNPLFMYPVHVEWTKKKQPDQRDGDIFTVEGNYTVGEVKPWDIVLLDDEEEDDEEVGQIAGVINYDIAKAMHEDEEKRSVDDRKFKVGERVWSPYFGGGTVTDTESEAGDVFPIEVHWNDGHLGDYDFFTEDGKYTVDGEKPEMGIYHIDPKDAEKVLPTVLQALNANDEDTVERMEDALNKKTEDAVNPAHYKVDGLPEAIDIINHLMHREQYEGFLWGNILKYAYRYGRKGDKADTAGKIAWYATQLKELEEERRK